MARPKMKLTGFARFVIVMLFIVPLAYVGASYYNGEDGLQNLKRMVGLETKAQDSKPAADRRNPGADDVPRLKARIEELEAHNLELKARIEELEKGNSGKKEEETPKRLKWGS